MRIYEDFVKTSENREPQRSYYIPYDTLEKALAGKKEASAFYKKLNGTWEFAFFKRDIDVPERVRFTGHAFPFLRAGRRSVMKSPGTRMSITLIRLTHRSFPMTIRAEYIRAFSQLREIGQKEKPMLFSRECPPACFYT